MAGDPSGDPDLAKFLGPELPDSFSPLVDTPVHRLKKTGAFRLGLCGAFLGGCWGLVMSVGSVILDPRLTAFDGVVAIPFATIILGTMGAAVGWLLGYVIDNV